MLEENKNKSHIKDNSSIPTLNGQATLVPYQNSIFQIGSYTKTNKLISALYMVTDIMDKEEPLRTKLRNLGASIISDIHRSDKGHALYNKINNTISEILSFMEIATSVRIVSEMNASILKKEFLELSKSIIDINPPKEENWLEEFIKEEDNFDGYSNVLETKKGGVFSVLKSAEFPKGQVNYKGQNGTRIGVQKADTLMKVLSDRIPGISKTNNSTNLHIHRNEDVTKKRREEIVLVIKDRMKMSPNFEGATITDIKSNGHEMLSVCSEKTLQRELVAMVFDGVLKKTGEKRWSRYSLK